MLADPAAAPTSINRLARETSPYLLQHAHNPVDWYAWGEEAFEAARAQDRPIFLSVGYSTCYWCHVMERQSFENPAIAAEMNRRFINIKVDREERPDVDQLYMTAVQLLTRHGGWPMSVFLTPDRKPFYGGTYYPPDDMHGRPGFVTVLSSVDEAYRDRKDDVLRATEDLANMLRQLAEPRPLRCAVEIAPGFVDALVNRSTADYDRHHGGFGGAPKFPRQTLLGMLLVHNRHHPDTHRLRQVTHTLDAIAQGGIHDHLGGGFHRYSTDAKWLVPHFEIMLYDNAMLAWCYVEAFCQTGEARYASVARGVFDFVLREMTSPDGAFYTAFDAEVDAQEGLSYLWTRAEIEQVLAGSPDLSLFLRVFGVDRGPNFADPHHGAGVPDKNILFLPVPLEEVARELKTTADALEAQLAPLRQLLCDARRRRKQPLLDTKILTSWNALMIGALAYGGQVLREPRYVAAAARAAAFILNRHWDLQSGGGVLYRTSRDGTRKNAGFLDDYAFTVRALIALHEASGDDLWKERAAALANEMVRRFHDEQHGGFYFTDADATDLFVRQKTATDSPLPSGNAAAALAMLELGRPEICRRTLGVFAQMLADQAEGMSAMVEGAVCYLQANEPFTVAAAPADRVATPEQLARQVVTAGGQWVNDAEFHLHLRIAAPYHLNGHEPGEGLIATQVTVVEEPGKHVKSIEYPPGDRYGGETVIVIRFDRSMAGIWHSLRLALGYQPCNEESCLPAVTLHLEAPLPAQP